VELLLTGGSFGLHPLADRLVLRVDGAPKIEKELSENDRLDLSK
jgi:hypothetical protein